MAGKPVIVFRDILLPMSETFIRSQGESLREFEAHYLGSRRNDGLELPCKRVHVLNERGAYGRAQEAAFKLFGYAPKLQKKIAAIRPLLVHAHFGSGGALALPLAKRARLPLIVTFHGSDAAMKDEWSSKSHYSQSLYVRRRPELIEYGTLFLAVSNFVKRKLLACGFPDAKVQVHYIGVDLDFFQCRCESLRRQLVLFVGRLERNKGGDYLIRAMARVQMHLPSAELVIIGEGPERASLERMASETGCRCRFLGPQKPEVVRDWLQRAQVFSVPSVTEPSGISEGFGLVFAEAQAMGVPVVSFRTGGIPEAVEDGVTGFLGTERDWEYLAYSIQLLLENEELRQRFSDSAASFVKARFNLAKQAALLEHIYTQVSNGRNSIRQPEELGVLH